MDRENIRKIARNPQYISRIYNYCDRWCERCTFTSCCMNYALSEEEFGDPLTRDVNNKAFWKKLGEIFSVTMQLVKEKALEMGIDLDAIDYTEITEEQTNTREIAEKQSYSLAAIKYTGLVDNWFEINKELLESKGDELLSYAQANIPDANPEADTVKINDCIEVISWYKHQIYVKLIRAATGLIESKDNCNGYVMDDANGSAKVAIIGIERSIAAWAGLLKYFPEQEGGILEILIILKRLLFEIDTAFQNARFFLRPGFDS